MVSASKIEAVTWGVMFHLSVAPICLGSKQREPSRQDLAILRFGRFSEVPLCRNGLVSRIDGPVDTQLNVIVSLQDRVAAASFAGRSMFQRSRESG